jgi:ribosomal protein S18 acetylase RimI-like enzyme
MSDPSIRFIGKSDLPAFKALRLEALRGHPDTFGSDYEENLDRPESFWIERVEKLVDNPDGCAVVAESEKELAGMVGVWREEGRKCRHNAHIWGVYVHPAHRGKKLMDRMIDCAIEWCKSNGIRIVRLTVATHNPAAIRCYLRCGFTVYGVSPAELLVDGRFIDELLLFRRI